MKKTLVSIVGLCSLFAFAVAGAQTYPTTVGGSAAGGTGTAQPGYVLPGQPVGSPGQPPSVIGYPVPVPPPTPGGDVIQFNNLVVQSVSSQSVPSEIIAINDMPYPTPMMGGAQSNGPAAAPTMLNSAKCFRYENKNSAAGSTIPCPTPAASSGSANAPSMMYPVQASGTQGTQMWPPYRPTMQYRIEISADTKLFLRDRTQASLSDFAYGDRINVFGFYNSDGTINALFVRNLSKPFERQIVQLNNVELISISSMNIPAHLVVVQRSMYPCYGFDSTGGAQKAIACPMGLKSFSDNPATQNVTLPQSMMPVQNALRKYDVLVDAQTIIVSRERARLLLSDLKVGDKLNIYGQTSDTSGAVIDADIVRDISQPPAAEDFQGTVTQVNTDGSFVIQASDGSSYTVQNPIKVGVMVRLRGVLDSLQKIISQVSQLFVNSQPTPLGIHCGGFIANPQSCPVGYYCKLNAIADTGGICVPSVLAPPPMMPLYPGNTGPGMMNSGAGGTTQPQP